MLLNRLENVPLHEGNSEGVKMEEDDKGLVSLCMATHPEPQLTCVVHRFF
jgi:hypothetical protein